MAPLNEHPVHFVTLGMFIIDDFSFSDENGVPTGKIAPSQIGGGGTYANIGARIWLPANKLGMIVDRGNDFPATIQASLENYGSDMWFFRDNHDRQTTRSLNSYQGQHRNFEYTTPRLRITPRDLDSTRLANPRVLHFICSPSRASVIMSEVRMAPGWTPMVIYEPIPYHCNPEHLPALVDVLPSISVLSPNAEEALSLLSLPLPPTEESIERAADQFLAFGIGEAGEGHVIIRSGGMGAYIKSRKLGGRWLSAFWTGSPQDAHRIVDVTGAGNSFLGGLAAGLLLADWDVYKAAYHASVSASFIIEQDGLPRLSRDDNGLEQWNGDSPGRRLELLRARHDNE